MRQSNGYIIIFSVALTIVCGGLLAAASVFLRPTQNIQEELDTKKKILSAVTTIPESYKAEQILEMYDEKISSVIVNVKGEVLNIEGVNAEDINIRNQFKEPNPEKMILPVFMFKSEVDENAIESYVLPVYGNGLWDNIWGYVAIGSDFNTINGAIFDHKAETPGLGARITDEKVQDRFQGRKIFGPQGKVQVEVLKGEGNTIPEDDPYSVDGLSGATMTSNGVNNMLKKYFNYYKPYFNKKSKEMPNQTKNSDVGKDDGNTNVPSDTYKSKGVIGE